MKNNKTDALYKVLDYVVECCAMDIDGEATLTAEDILSKCRRENVCMTRCIFVTQLKWLGYSNETVAQVLHRDEVSVRNILNAAHQYRISSKAYRIAEAEATIKCNTIEA